jgi:hypothetical protein
VADVRARVDIVDRRGDVELLAHSLSFCVLHCQVGGAVIPDQRQAGEEPAFSLVR